MTVAAKGYFDALVKLGELASDSQGSKELGERAVSGDGETKTYRGVYGEGGEDDSWRENWGKCPSVLHVFVREEMRTGAHEETLKQKNREKGRVEPLLGD